MIFSFVCLIPVRLLLSSMAVLYHVNGYLQQAYFFVFFSFTPSKTKVKTNPIQWMTPKPKTGHFHVPKPSLSKWGQVEWPACENDFLSWMWSGIIFTSKTLYFPLEMWTTKNFVKESMNAKQNFWGVRLGWLACWTYNQRTPSLSPALS